MSLLDAARKKEPTSD